MKTLNPMAKRQRVNRAEVKRLRASEALDDTAVLAIANKLYEEDPGVYITAEPPPLYARDSSFQIMYFAQATVMWKNFKKVREILKES